MSALLIPLVGDYPALFGLVLTGLSTVGTLIGIVVTGLGKRGDQQAQAVTDEFKRMLDEVTYWHAETIESRSALSTCEQRLRALGDSQSPSRKELP